MNKAFLCIGFSCGRHQFFFFMNGHLCKAITAAIYMPKTSQLLLWWPKSMNENN